VLSVLDSMFIAVEKKTHFRLNEDINGKKK